MKYLTIQFLYIDYTTYTVQSNPIIESIMLYLCTRLWCTGIPEHWLKEQLNQLGLGSLNPSNFCLLLFFGFLCGIYNLNFSYSIYSVLCIIIPRNRKYLRITNSRRARSTWTKRSTHALAGCGPSGPLISRDSTLVRAQRSGKGVNPGQSR